MRLAWPRFLVRALVFVVVAISVLAGAPWRSGAQAGDGPVYLVRVTGTIDLGTAPYVDRALSDAEDDGAAAIVIDIDTPGGRLDAVLQMREAIVDTGIRTIALVDSTAFSAGALVAIASDEIYMTPGAVMGAATPVVGATGETADEKTISAVRATFEATAEENGRDPEVAAAMVDQRVEIEGLVGDDELLTLTVSDALEVGYAEGRTTDLDTLLVDLGLDGNELVATSPGFAERVVQILTNPVVAGILLLGGFLLIVGDLVGGGLGLGTLGGIALLSTFFWGHMLAGLAGWEDVALVLIGLALIAVEVFIVPGFGVVGILGFVALGGGAFLAMIYRDLDFVSSDDLWQAGLTVVLTLAAAVVGTMVLIALLSRRGAPSGLVLSTQLGGGQTVTERSSTGWLRWFGGEDTLEPDRIERPEGPDVDRDESWVGATGVAASDLRPAGIADIDGHRIDVVTSGEYLRAGEPIEVIRDDRYRRVVRRRP